jgi:hypothetical protein
MAVKNVFRQGCSSSVVVVDPTQETAMLPVLFPGGATSLKSHANRTQYAMGNKGPVRPVIKVWSGTQTGGFLEKVA